MNFTLLGYPAILASDTADNSREDTKYNYGLLEKYQLSRYATILDLNSNDVLISIPGTDFVGLRINTKGSYVCLHPDDVIFILDWITEFNNFYNHHFENADKITVAVRYINDAKMLADTVNTDFNFISVAPPSIYARLLFGKKLRKQDINTIKMIDLLSDVTYHNEKKGSSLQANRGAQALLDYHFSNGARCVFIDPYNVSQRYMDLISRLKDKGLEDNDIRTLVNYLSSASNNRITNNRVPSAFTVSEKFIGESVAIPISFDMGIGDTIIDCVNSDYQDIHYSDSADRRILSTKNFGITINGEEYLYPVPTTFEIHAPNNKIIYPFGIKMTAHWKKIDSGTIFQVAGAHPVWSYLSPERIFEYINELDAMDITILHGKDSSTYDSYSKGRWKYPYMNIKSTPVSNDLSVCQVSTYPASDIYNTEYYLIKGCNESTVKSGTLSRMLSFFNPLTSKLSVTIDYNHMVFHNQQKDN